MQVDAGEFYVQLRDSFKESIAEFDEDVSEEDERNALAVFDRAYAKLMANGREPRKRKYTRKTKRGDDDAEKQWRDSEAHGRDSEK